MTPEAPFRRFVALGDSILSDDFPGPRQGAASLLHRNRDDLFPDFSGRDLLHRYPGIEFVQETRTGHTCQDVFRSLDKIGHTPERTLVTLSVGGNDLMQGLSHQTPLDTLLAQIRRNLGEVVRRIHQGFPQHRLLFNNLYDPTDGTGVVQSSAHRGAPPMAAALEGLTRLNELIGGLGVEVVDVHKRFRGHGMRARDPDYEHYQAEDPSGWICYDIEPNPRGASEVRRCYWEVLDAS